MKIGLIDVDGHNFPNLALMKLSAWHKAKGDEVHDSFRKMMEEHEEALKRIHHMLRDVLEEVGEYMNDNDIVQDVDVAINSAIYDLVYERKTEKDYESAN